MKPPERFAHDDPREWLNRARSSLARAKVLVPGGYPEEAPALPVDGLGQEALPSADNVREASLCSGQGTIRRIVQGEMARRRSADVSLGHEHGRPDTHITGSEGLE